MNRLDLKNKRRTRRKQSVRRKITGVPEMPRLTVFKSLNHIYAQIIDDTLGTTLAAASTIDKDVREALKLSKTKKVDQSKLVGAAIAKRAIASNIKTVAFDRNGNLYHGRVKALADAAREAGLQF